MPGAAEGAHPEETVSLSPTARRAYGIEVFDYDSWRYYEACMLTLSGLEGDALKLAKEWITGDFALSMGVPERVNAFLRSFEPPQSRVRSLLSRATLDAPVNTRRALLYDTVRMTRSIGQPFNTQSAARQLLVGVDIALAIAGLADMELTNNKSRMALFQLKSLIDTYEMVPGTAEEQLAMPGAYRYSRPDRLIASWVNYAYALLIVAGADGEVSEAERDWLFHDFARVAGASEEMIELVSYFDYKHYLLEDVLPKIEMETEINFKRTLLYHSIKMARADKHLAAEEHQAYRQAAKLLGIADDVAFTIERIVEMEETLERMRCALLQLENG